MKKIVFLSLFLITPILTGCTSTDSYGSSDTNDYARQQEFQKAGDTCFDQCNEYYDPEDCMEIGPDGERYAGNNCKFNSCFNGCMENN